MENLLWRSRAKVVAWVHLILLALSLLGVIAAATIVTVAVNNSNSYPYSKSNEFSSTLVMTLWIIVGVTIIFTTIEMYGTITLRNATKPTTGAIDCYRKCKIYIIITSIMLALQVIGYINGIIFYSHNTNAWLIISGLVSIVLRATFIYVASKFRTEVEPYALN